MTNAGTPQKSRTAQNRIFVLLLILGSLSGVVNRLERVETVAHTLHSVAASFASAGQKLYVTRIAPNEASPAEINAGVSRTCPLEEMASAEAVADASIIGGITLEPTVLHQPRSAVLVPAKRALRLKIMRLPELQAKAAIDEPKPDLPPVYVSLPNVRLAQAPDIKLPDDLVQVGARIFIREAYRFHEREMQKALKQKLQLRHLGSTQGVDFLNFVGSLASASGSLEFTE